MHMQSTKQGQTSKIGLVGLSSTIHNKQQARAKEDGFCYSEWCLPYAYLKQSPPASLTEHTKAEGMKVKATVLKKKKQCVEEEDLR